MCNSAGIVVEYQCNNTSPGKSASVNYVVRQIKVRIGKNMPPKLCRCFLEWNELQKKAATWLPHIVWNSSTTSKLSTEVYRKKFDDLDAVEKAVRETFPPPTTSESETSTPVIPWDEYLRRSAALSPQLFKGPEANTAQSHLAREYKADKFGHRLKEKEERDAAEREAMEREVAERKEAERNAAERVAAEASPAKRPRGSSCGKNDSPKPKRRTIQEMREELRAHGIRTSGTLPELQERLSQVIEQPASDTAPPLQFRVVDHSRDYLLIVKQDLHRELEQNGMCAGQHISTNTQEGVSCGYIAACLAERLSRNPAGSRLVPTDAELRRWFVKTTRSDFGMSETRHSALLAAVHSQKDLLPLVTEELQRFCAHQTALNDAKGAAGRVRYASKYEGCTSSVSARNLRPYDVLIVFVSRSRQETGHFYVITLEPRQPSAVSCTEMQESGRGNVSAKTADFFKLRLPQARDAKVAVGNKYMECSVCVRYVKWLGEMPANACSWMAGRAANGNSSAASFSRHKETMTHKNAAHIMCNGINNDVDRIVVIAATAAAYAASKASADNVSFADAARLLTRIAVVPLRMTPEERDKFINLHIPLFGRVCRGCSARASIQDLQLDVLRGVPLPDRYATEGHLHEMVQIWATLRRADIAALLHGAVVMTIVLDGSTLARMRRSECYIVVCRFWKGCEIREVVCALLEFGPGECTDGRTIHEKVVAALAAVGVSPEQVVAVCSDDASALTGNQNGLVGHFRRSDNRCLKVVDASHKLETLVTPALKDTTVSHAADVFDEIEAAMRSSGKLHRHFTEHAQSKGATDLLSPATHHTIRWLPKYTDLYLRGARMWRYWTSHMEECQSHWHSADRTHQKDDLADKRRSLLPKLREPTLKKNFARLVPLMEVLKRLSLVTQQKDLALAELLTNTRHVCSFLRSDNELKDLRIIKNVVKGLDAFIEYYDKDETMGAVAVLADVQRYRLDNLEEAQPRLLALAAAQGRSVPDRELQLWPAVANRLHTEAQNACCNTAEKLFGRVLPEIETSLPTIHSLLALIAVANRSTSNIVERLFSHIKHRIGDRRGSMTMSSLEDEILVHEARHLLLAKADLHHFLIRGLCVWEAAAARRMHVSKTKPQETETGVEAMQTRKSILEDLPRLPNDFADL